MKQAFFLFLACCFPVQVQALWFSAVFNLLCVFLPFFSFCDDTPAPSSADVQSTPTATPTSAPVGQSATSAPTPKPTSAPVGQSATSAPTPTPTSAPVGQSAPFGGTLTEDSRFDAVVFYDDMFESFFFGSSVAIDGDFMVVGAIGFGEFRGTVQLYEKTSDGGWAKRPGLKSGGSSAFDTYGGSVAISGETAVVGAKGDGGGTATVHIRDPVSTDWVKQAVLTPPSGRDGGWSVDISGDTIVVGSPYLYSSTGKGAVFVYSRSGSTWEDPVELVGSESLEGDHFGISVAISEDSNTVVVGAPSGYSTYTKGRLGKVFLFVRSPGASSWTQQGEPLTASDGEVDDWFGNSVDISQETVVVGNNVEGAEKTGGAYVFVRSVDSWTEQAKLIPNGDSLTGSNFGYEVAVSGSIALVGAPRSEAYKGTVYAFARAGTMWTHRYSLVASDRIPSSWFGASVALDRNGQAVVGATQEEVDGLVDSGAIYTFDLN